MYQTKPTVIKKEERDDVAMTTTTMEEAELAFRIQKGLEAEARGRKELEEAYCQGYDWLPGWDDCGL